MTSCTDYKTDRKWADGFLPQVSDILKSNAMHIVKVEIAPDDIDVKQATDMIVTVSGGKVAIRVRRRSCARRDWTIRSRRKSGALTELHKLRQGFCDWYLYAWEDREGNLSEWILVDLNKFRDNGGLDNLHSEIPNYDGRSSFIAIPLKEVKCLDSLVAYEFPSNKAEELGLVSQPSQLGFAQMRPAEV